MNEELLLQQDICPLKPLMGGNEYAHGHKPKVMVVMLLANRTR